jgi:hypothetical protein
MRRGGVCVDCVPQVERGVFQCLICRAPSRVVRLEDVEAAREAAAEAASAAAAAALDDEDSDATQEA